RRLSNCWAAPAASGGGYRRGQGSRGSDAHPRPGRLPLHRYRRALTFCYLPITICDSPAENATQDNRGHPCVRTENENLRADGGSRSRVTYNY
ncbi:MAG: hypothetical protein M3319_01430, partial [Actinomycetota bacterium]|nr:hypothetical protein [Actinomycetota bacterium]